MEKEPGSAGGEQPVRVSPFFFCASAFDTGSCQQFAGLLRVRLDTPARRNIS